MIEKVTFHCFQNFPKQNTLCVQGVTRKPLRAQGSLISYISVPFLPIKHWRSVNQIHAWFQNFTSLSEQYHSSP